MGCSSSKASTRWRSSSVSRRRSRGEAWAVGIGSPMRMVTFPVLTMPDPNGSTSRVPFSAMGTSGTPALMAMNAAPSLKSSHLAGARAAAFGKDEQRDSFFADHLRRQRHGLHRGARIFARNADVTGASQMPAQERNLKEPAFGEKPEAHRNTWPEPRACPCSSDGSRRKHSCRLW